MATTFAFAEAIEKLDLKLFEKIPSQTTDHDKRSLLSCQLAVRKLLPEYSYLEIGSHLGGSLQPYLLDPNCSRIYSIDKRPLFQPDERGIDYRYDNNSTERMLQNLRAVSEPALSKITCIDDDASNIEPDKIEHQPQLCFIDGEHTDTAVFSDFSFCMKVLAHNGAIVFHDSGIIYNGLSRIVSYLTEQGVSFNAYNLPDAVFVIEVNDFPLHATPHIQQMLINNHVGYLTSLKLTDHYRQFANKPIFKLLRKLQVKVKGGSVSI